MPFFYLILAALLWVFVLLFWCMTSDSKLLFRKVLGWVLSAEATGIASGFVILAATSNPTGVILIIGSLGLGSFFILASLACLGIETLISGN